MRKNTKVLSTNLAIYLAIYPRVCPDIQYESYELHFQVTFIYQWVSSDRSRFRVQAGQSSQSAAVARQTQAALANQRRRFAIKALREIPRKLWFQQKLVRRRQSQSTP